MKASDRKVRSLIARSYITLMIVSFVLFALTIVTFVFALEDEIFERQVREAAEKFNQADIEKLSRHGSTMQSLDMLYYVGFETMPEWLRSKIDPTLEDAGLEVFAEDHGHFHGVVRPLDGGERLYVFFNARRFIVSTPLLLGVLPYIGGGALLALLITFYFLHRISRRVSVPLETMAANFAKGNDVDGAVEVSNTAPAEIQALAAAIRNRDARIQALLERERQFNRDASHELRTPLAVASGAAEVLEEVEGKSKALSRLRTAIRDMQLLTEGILWLGRDAAKSEGCNASKVCQECIDAYAHLVGNRKVTVSLEALDDVAMPVPEPVAHVLAGNILRNALSYTDAGAVTVSVAAGAITVSDTGVGYGHVDQAREGFGIGLSLVNRLCQHFGVGFTVQAGDEAGTKACLVWEKQNTSGI